MRRQRDAGRRAARARAPATSGWMNSPANLAEAGRSVGAPCAIWLRASPRLKARKMLKRFSIRMKAVQHALMVAPPARAAAAAGPDTGAGEMKTHRVGLLVDGYEQPGWMHELVGMAGAQPGLPDRRLLVAGRAGAKRRRISAPGLSARCPVSSPGCLEASRALALPRPARAPARSDTEIVEMTAGGGAARTRTSCWTSAASTPRSSG